MSDCVGQGARASFLSNQRTKYQHVWALFWNQPLDLLYASRHCAEFQSQWLSKSQKDPNRTRSTQKLCSRDRALVERWALRSQTEVSREASVLETGSKLSHLHRTSHTHKHTRPERPKLIDAMQYDAIYVRR